MSERFAYIPSIGFCMVVAVLLYRYLKKGEKVKAFHQLRTPLMVAAGITLLFSIKTLTRNPVWKDNFTLFSTDINTAPNSAKMRNAMGGELVTQSQKPENKLKQQEMLTEAVGHLREAVKIHPNYKNAYLLMGNANNYLKQYDAAITAYNQALAVDPAYTEAETNLAITYMQAGRYYGQERNNLPKSIEFLEKSIELRPNEYETLRLLGVAYGISGRPSEAIEYFTRALNVRPNDPDAMYNLGNAYYNIGQNNLGEEWHQKAFNLDPNLLEKRRSAVKPQ
jgi:tetratricopeptide (TPR) repeat protein